MILITRYGQVELAEYPGDSPSSRAFALWFEEAFNHDLDYTNRDAFEDDFYWGLVSHEKFSGIAHMGCIPEFFDETFYPRSCRRVAKDAAEKGKPLFFSWSSTHPLT
jgi:hypothetical protein